MAEKNKNMLGETAAYSQTAFLWFNLITLIFFGFKYVTLGNSGDNKSNKIYTGIYLLALLLVIGIINFDAIKTKCVNPNGEINTEVYIIAIISTFLPWILIFCSLMLVLNFFPGWKAPFSNTIGYLVVSMAGIKNLILNIIESDYEKTVDVNKVTENVKILSMAVNNIYSDPSLIINEITPENFNQFWENLKPVMRKGAYNDALLKGKLFKFVSLKDMISEYIWYALTSLIITSVSYNYILSKDCKETKKIVLDDDAE